MAINPIVPGYTFSGTSPNNSVTAPKLNNLVGLATITVALITDQTEKVTPAAADMFLIWDSATNTFKKASYTNFIPTSRGKTGSTALVMSTLTAATIAVDAREIEMKTTAGLPYVANSFSVTLNMATSGANGLDTGVEAANTWYYLYAISTGTVDRGLISASSTSPTLPTNYIYYALLGCVRNDASSNFLRFAQNGNKVGINLPSLAAVASANLNPYTGGVEFTNIAAAAANTFQTADLSRCIPPGIVADVTGILGHTQTTNGTLRGFGVASSSDGSLTGPGLDSGKITPGLQVFTTLVTTSQPIVAGFTACGMFTVPIATSQQIVWATNTNAGSIHSMRVTGFTLNL